MKQAKDRGVAMQAAQLAQGDLQEALKLEPDDQELKDMNAKVVAWLSQAKAWQKKDDDRKRRREEVAAEKHDAALYLKELEGIVQPAGGHLWDRLVVPVRIAEGRVVEEVRGQALQLDVGIRGRRFRDLRGWRRRSLEVPNSDTFVSDLLMTYPAGDRTSILQLQKGAFYKIRGRLKRTSTLLGLSGQSL